MTSTDCNYYSNDFDFELWRIECYRDLEVKLPLVCPQLYSNRELSVRWEDFFRNHQERPFYQSRNYLIQEFRAWLESARVLFEVGCGHGSSAFPLLSKLQKIELYVATDYSSEALGLLHRAIRDDETRIITVLWDISESFDYSQLEAFGESFSSAHGEEAHTVTSKSPVADVVLCIFTLSALPPDSHVNAIRNMSSVLRPGGVILFRDYGLYDMTMFRHTCRVEERLFLRLDGTLAYYFDKEYLQSIATEAGLLVAEVEMATVLNKNRKKGKSMRRVFIHAVLQKPYDAS
jgi:methyltransferase-like protein 6